MLPISAMIYEPSTHMLDFLCKSGLAVHGDADCLPRRSISELRYGLNFLRPKAFIVRSSELHQSTELGEMVFNLHSQNVEIIIVQDSGLKFLGSTVSFRNLHFVSNLGETDELNRLVALAQLKAISRQSQRTTLP